MRKEEEKRNREDRAREIENDDEEWKTRKTRELEIKEKKRRRPSKVKGEMNEDVQPGEEKRRFTKIEKNWGEVGMVDMPRPDLDRRE